MNSIKSGRSCGFGIDIYPWAVRLKTALTLAGLFICYVMIIPLFWGTAQASDVDRITKERLNVMIEKSDPIIIDVRLERHWENSVYKIKGAVRGNPEEFQAWFDIHPKTSVLVLYCA